MTTDNDFDPVEDLDGTMRALTQPQWGQTIEGIGQDLRIATKLLEKTKAELIEGSRKLDKEGMLLELIDSLHQTKELCESYGWLVGKAEARLLIAASTFAEEDQP